MVNEPTHPSVWSVQPMEAHEMIVTHDSNLPTKLVLDFARFDSIWRILIDDLEQFYFD